MCSGNTVDYHLLKISQTPSKNSLAWSCPSIFQCFPRILGSLCCPKLLSFFFYYLNSYLSLCRFHKNQFLSFLFLHHPPELLLKLLQVFHHRRLRPFVGTPLHLCQLPKSRLLTAQIFSHLTLEVPQQHASLIQTYLRRHGYIVSDLSSVERHWKGRVSLKMSFLYIFQKVGQRMLENAPKENCHPSQGKSLRYIFWGWTGWLFEEEAYLCVFLKIQAVFIFAIVDEAINT